MKCFTRRLWNDDTGQGLGEYILILALVCTGLLLMALALTVGPSELLGDGTGR